jgi:hypothetical protein
MNHLTNRSGRPTLEALEDRDVPSAYLAAEFPGYGVWLYTSSNTHWTQLTAANASQVAADSNGDVVAEIPGQGVWLYDGAWQQLTTNNATLLDASNGVGYITGATYGTPYTTLNVVAEFPGQGLWRFTDFKSPSFSNQSWSQLTPSNASTFAVDPNGYVVAEFPGYGVWYYGRAGWQQLTPADAASVAINAPTVYAPFTPPQTGPSVVAAAFAGYGVWRITVNGPTADVWHQLTASDAATLGVNSAGAVVGEFPGWGVWTYSDAGAGGYGPGWNQLTAADATMVGIDTYGNVFGQFGVAGVWYDQVGSWIHLTPSNASSFGVVD